MNELASNFGKTPSDKHPQFKILYRAKECLQKLNDFCKDKNLSALLVSQAEMYQKNLKEMMDYLTPINHNIVFIGEVGVGKTTAECFLMGLTVPGDTTKDVLPKTVPKIGEGGTTGSEVTLPQGEKEKIHTEPQSKDDVGVEKTTVECSSKNQAVFGDTTKNVLPKVVLETGAGRITVCEVIIQQGDKVGIRIEPQSDTEIYNLVTEYCAGLLESEVATETHKSEKSQKIGVSEEIARVIRNMAGLTRKNQKEADGKTYKIEPAMELIKSITKESDSPRMRLDKLFSEVLSRLHLRERTRKEIWCDRNTDADCLTWLKEFFAKINKGMLKDMSLPRCVEVIVPPSFLQNHAYQLRLIDTKGIDETAIRPDLQKWLEEPRSLTVLCTRFMPAPDTNVKELLKHLIEMGQTSLIKERLLLMVLSRPGEAKETKDDEGNEVKTDDDGYAEKESQVNSALKLIGVSELPILFFNAHGDDPAPIFQELVKRLEQMRLAYSQRIENIVAATDQLIEERDSEVQRKVIKTLQVFLQQHRTVCGDIKSVHNDCVEALRTSHAKTVYATVSRKGKWDNLDCYFLLGQSTRKEASRCSQKAFYGLEELLKNMLGQEDLKPAYGFLEQLLSKLELWKQDFLTDSQNSGKEVFREVLDNAHVWSECVKLWGGGSGFRQQVANNLQEWFVSPEQAEFHEQLKTRIKLAWDNSQLMRELRQLCADVQ